MGGRIDPLWVVKQQDAIISIQSGVIDELFMLLMQHVSMDEAGRLPCVERINEAARLRAGLYGEENVPAPDTAQGQEGGLDG